LDQRQQEVGGVGERNGIAIRPPCPEQFGEFRVRARLLLDERTPQTQQLCDVDPAIP
jgi:hypothetical protein